MLSRLDPDVVHAAGSEPKSALAARLAGAPLVVDWCGEEVPRLLDRALGATDDAELVGALRAAVELPYRTYDARFERFSEAAVLESYLDLYRELGAE